MEGKKTDQKEVGIMVDSLRTGARQREKTRGRRERREGVDAQEAHLYAFPLITGRGQWLPLHNGFASASHLLPASLGEEVGRRRGAGGTAKSKKKTAG